MVLPWLEGGRGVSNATLPSCGPSKVRPRRVSCSDDDSASWLGAGSPNGFSHLWKSPGAFNTPGFHATNFPQETGDGGSDAF